MALTGFLLALSTLSVSPNRPQIFKYETFTLSCEMSSVWRVKAKTVRGVSECGRDWGKLEASTCVIKEAYHWNSGEYWCESTSGERSPAANITVTDSNVALESPVFPVTEGQSVTLRCRTQSNSSDQQASIFRKNRSVVGAAITGQMTIPAVSKSDEGLYMCMIPDVGESAESWLFVRGPGAPAAPLLSVSRLMCHVVVGVPYLLSTILLGLICRDRARDLQDGSADVTQHQSFALLSHCDLPPPDTSLCRSVYSGKSPNSGDSR
ncbi:low affinity immunoglobulin gamma Fc region receptor II-like isoform X7 [Epinephelus lanceolatus]